MWPALISQYVVLGGLIGVKPCASPAEVQNLSKFKISASLA
jgi:hypothetical protein